MNRDEKYPMISRRSFIIATPIPFAFLSCGCRPASTGKRSKKLCWVQALKGHPVHQLTQIAFKDACRELGYQALIIGSDGPDLVATISFAEQAIALGDIAGMAVWTGNPAFNALIETASLAHIPVILPHFPVAEGAIPGASGVVACDPALYAREAAIKLGERVRGEGNVAITQGSFNTTENQVAETFTRVLKQRFPRIKVAPPIEEGFDPPAAVAKIAALVRSNPRLVAGFSTTGGGALAWAEARAESRRDLVVVAMDYTRFNLDLVKHGDIYAVIGQPLWEESREAAFLLDRLIQGQKIPWWTKAPAPFITKHDLSPHYARLEKVESALRGEHK